MSLLRATLRRDWALQRSYRTGLVLDLGASLINLTLFFFVGRLVDSGGTQLADSPGGYFAYALIGLAAVRLALPALQSPPARVRSEQTTGTLEAVAASPTPLGRVLLAGNAYPVVQALVQVIALLALACLVADVRLDVTALSAAAALLALFGLLALLSGVGLLLAGVTAIVKQASALVSFAASALVLASAVYFPTSSLPAGLRGLAEALPTTQGVAVVRAALLVGDARWEASFYTAVAGGMMLLLGGTVFRLLSAAARQRGTLGQY